MAHKLITPFCLFAVMEAANALVSLDPQQQQQPLPERQRRQLRRRPQVQMPAPPNWHPYAAEGALVGLDPGRKQCAGASRASAAPGREERTAKGMTDYHGVSWHTRNMKWRMTLTILQQWDGAFSPRLLTACAELSGDHVQETAVLLVASLQGPLMHIPEHAPHVK